MTLYSTNIGKTSVEVLEGSYGRYVRLSRNIADDSGETKKRWLNISPTIWSAIKHSMEQLSSKLDQYEATQGEVTLPLPSKCFLTISDFLDVTYVGLKQIRGQYTNRMNFSTQDWCLLAGEIDTIESFLGDSTEVLKTAKKRRVQPAHSKGKKVRTWPSKISVFRVGEGVYVRKSEALSQASLYTPNAEVVASKIDMISSRDLALLVGRSQFSGELNRLRKEGCIGCLVDHPSQMQHPCLMDDWDMSIESRYEDIKKILSFDLYWGLICRVFEALKLPSNETEAREIYEKNIIKEAMMENYPIQTFFDNLINNCP